MLARGMLGAGLVLVIVLKLGRCDARATGVASGCRRLSFLLCLLSSVPPPSSLLTCTCVACTCGTTGIRSSDGLLEIQRDFRRLEMGVGRAVKASSAKQRKSSTLSRVDGLQRVVSGRLNAVRILIHPHASIHQFVVCHVAHAHSKKIDSSNYHMHKAW